MRNAHHIVLVCHGELGHVGDHVASTHATSGRGVFARAACEEEELVRWAEEPDV